jgi:hypothetical protein
MGFYQETVRLKSESLVLCVCEQGEMPLFGRQVGRLVRCGCLTGQSDDPLDLRDSRASRQGAVPVVYNDPCVVDSPDLVTWLQQLSTLADCDTSRTYAERVAEVSVVMIATFLFARGTQ